MVELVWHCVEDRIQSGSTFGRIGRKIIFGDIFADRKAILSNNPISPESHAHLQVRYGYALSPADT